MSEILRKYFLDSVLLLIAGEILIVLLMLRKCLSSTALAIYPILIYILIQSAVTHNPLYNLFYGFRPLIILIAAVNYSATIGKSDMIKFVKYATIYGALLILVALFQLAFGLDSYLSTGVLKNSGVGIYGSGTIEEISSQFRPNSIFPVTGKFGSYFFPLVYIFSCNSSMFPGFLRFIPIISIMITLQKALISTLAIGSFFSFISHKSRRLTCTLNRKTVLGLGAFLVILTCILILMKERLSALILMVSSVALFDRVYEGISFNTLTFNSLFLGNGFGSISAGSPALLNSDHSIGETSLFRLLYELGLIGTLAIAASFLLSHVIIFRKSLRSDNLYSLIGYISSALTWSFFHDVFGSTLFCLMYGLGLSFFCFSSNKALSSK